MDQLASRLIRRADTLKANRQVHESVWRECYDYTYPLRGAGFSSEVLDAQSANTRLQSCWTAQPPTAPACWRPRLCQG
jgi:hypothetical protein